jgi:hypothetical protein
MTGMHKLALTTSALGLALMAAMFPQDAFADNGASDIIRTGCHYSSYVRLNYSLEGQWANQLWDSASCKQSWVSFTPSWTIGPADQIAVYMLRYSPHPWVALGGARTYNWNGPGHYFSSMVPSDVAISPCAEVSYRYLPRKRNCNFTVIVR